MPLLIAIGARNNLSHSHTKTMNNIPFIHCFSFSSPLYSIHGTGDRHHALQEIGPPPTGESREATKKGKTMIYRLTTWMAGASLTVFAAAVALQAVFQYSIF